MTKKKSTPAENFPISVPSVYFTTSEFLIEHRPRVHVKIADKIWKNHILPMGIIRDLLGAPIMVSSNSGYRSEQYEKSKGRSGNSEHTFKGKGAADYTAEDLDKLEGLLIECSPYTRIARYETFIHCDYKANDGYKYIYSSDSASQWKLEEKIKIK